MEISEQIKLLRRALNLTRKELANLTGKSVDVIINVEEHGIIKNSNELLKYLVERQAEAIANLEAMTDAIKNIEFEKGENEDNGRKN